ncbi:MAG: Siroheme decarboxylase AhbA, alternate heme biosynthesis pathway / Siroheme decarboxylase AhbB, alternate heme biosynthesis pathway, partial [uncultured Solirubrobacteraceae bacterium]
GFSSATQGPLAQGRRGDPARRRRQAGHEPHAGLVPARAAAVRPRGAARGDLRGGGPQARRAPDRPPDHPPGHADLRHPRARLRLHARRRQGRPGVPAPRREVHQHAPGRHAQLPAQPRLQPVVHARRREGLEARAGRHARGHGARDGGRVDPPAPDAQALQDPHGPRDGEGHRRPLRGRRGQGAARAHADRGHRRGRRGHPRHPGRHADRLRALRARRRAPRRHPGGGPAPPRVPQGARRAAPRRRDPLPPPRRLQRERHGRVGRPGGQDPRDGQAHGLLPRDLALLRAPDLRRLALLRLHDGPRALQGGVRRDPRLDRRRHRHRAARDALLVDGVQEDPDALLPRRLRRLGAGARGRV